VPTCATDNIVDLPSPDLCFLCVKSHDLDAVCDSLNPNPAFIFNKFLTKVLLSQ
jgi:hypothetical protein